MRLTFLLWSLRTSGGLRVICGLADELIRRGHRVELLSSRDDRDSFDLTSRLPVSAVPGPSLPVPGLANVWRAARLLARLPPSDVLVANYYPTVYVALMARLLRGHRGRIAYLVQGKESLFCQGMLRAVKRQFVKWSYSLPVQLLVNTEWTAKEVLKKGQDHAHVIGAGIDTKVFRPLEGETRGEPGLVMTTGRLQRLKGYADFVEAMRQARRERPDLRALVVTQEDIQLPGEVPGEVVRVRTDSELAHCYRRASLFVSSSWSEGLALPPLEAMACGTPTALTDSGGVREYAEHGRNCLMSPPGRPDALARNITQLLGSAELRKRFSEAGPRVASRYSWTQVADLFEKALTVS